MTAAETASWPALTPDREQPAGDTPIHRAGGDDVRRLRNLLEFRSLAQLPRAGQTTRPIRKQTRRQSP